MNPGRGTAPRGFTLVEMAITLSLAVILLTMALPTLGSRLARQRLQSVAHHLVADLAQARHEAAQRQQPVYVVFRPGQSWCYALSLDEHADCRGEPGTNPRLLKAVHGADQPGVDLIDAVPMAVSPRDGRPLSGIGAVLLRTAGGASLRVQLSPMGRASLCTPSEPLAGIAACGAVALR